MHKIEPPTGFSGPHSAKAGRGRHSPESVAQFVSVTAAQDMNSTATGGDRFAV